ncbi:MAG TPA: CopG family transcriptional regulator [Thermoanaerobaculia bacterium]|nr:CopG family transcriptional regulator [Thermoanaerobaculia bacterium]
MELSKKTTLLFPPDLYKQLTRLARQRGVSVGELVRRACEAQYGVVSRESRLAAVRDLEAMSLPVGDPDQIERESVPSPEDLLP